MNEELNEHDLKEELNENDLNEKLNENYLNEKLNENDSNEMIWMKNWMKIIWMKIVLKLLEWNKVEKGYSCHSYPYPCLCVGRSASCLELKIMAGWDLNMEVNVGRN